MHVHCSYIADVRASGDVTMYKKLLWFITASVSDVQIYVSLGRAGRHVHQIVARSISCGEARRGYDMGGVATRPPAA
eukprot:7862581-Heterocapsa_arctica.AAC.1